MGLARDLGVANVRVEIPWYLIERQKGAYDWSRADVVFSVAAANGVQIQPTLLWSPAWAASLPSDPPSPGSFPAFVRDFLQRYEGKISVVELWNEPDEGSHHYWSGDNASYVREILVPGAAAAHQAVPGIRVAMGGSISDAAGCCAWLDGIYANGGGGSFDIAAFHNYNASVSAEAAKYHDDLVAHGQDAKPIWVGEYGVQDSAVADTEQQALMRAVLTDSSTSLEMAQWYNLRDDAAISCCPAKVEKMASWGLAFHDYGLKAGFTTMAELLGAPPPSSACLLYTSPSPRDLSTSRMPSSA